MNISEPFIRRPIATALLALGLALAGLAAYAALPIAPLPQVDIPTIVVWGGEPGADPVTTAASVIAPLERRLGAISGLTEMTSSSSLGGGYIILQFELSRRVDDAARDVQAAINAAGSDLPAGLPSPPGFGKFSPGAAPVLIMALASDKVTPATVYDAADSIVAPRIARLLRRLAGAGPRRRAAGHPRHHRPGRGQGGRSGPGRRAPGHRRQQRHPPNGLIDGSRQSAAITVNDRLTAPEDFGRIILRHGMARWCASPPSAGSNSTSGTASRAGRWMARRRC